MTPPDRPIPVIDHLVHLWHPRTKLEELEARIDALSAGINFLDDRLTATTAVLLGVLDTDGALERHIAEKMAERDR